MQDASAVRDLIDRWTQVWQEGRYDLAPGCIAPVYIRHESAATREVTPRATLPKMLRPANACQIFALTFTTTRFLVTAPGSA